MPSIWSAFDTYSSQLFLRTLHVFHHQRLAEDSICLKLRNHLDKVCEEISIFSTKTCEKILFMFWNLPKDRSTVPLQCVIARVLCKEASTYQNLQNGNGFDLLACRVDKKSSLDVESGHKSSIEVSHLMNPLSARPWTVSQSKASWIPPIFGDFSNFKLDR